MLTSLLKGIAGNLPVSVFRMFIKRDVLGIYYHVVSDEPLPHIQHLYPCKSRRAFEDDLIYLKENFYFITYEQLAAHLMAGQQIEPGAVILSFDDGLSECYHVVRPLLLKHGIPCTFFIPTGYIDNRRMSSDHKASLCLDRVVSLEGSVLSDALQFASDCLGQKLNGKEGLRHWIGTISASEHSTIDRLCRLLEVDVQQYLETRRPYMTSDEIRRMAAEGFTIGAHSVGHRQFDSMTDLEMEREIADSCRTIMAVSGASRVPFAFPFSADGVSRQTLREFRKKLKHVGLFFDTNGVSANRDRIINRMRGDWPGSSAPGTSNLPQLLVQAYVEDLAVKARRLWNAAGRIPSVGRTNLGLAPRTRILVISAHYPPYHAGGYEIRCKNIMDALVVRGYAVLALTSRDGTSLRTPTRDTAYPVCRRLHLSSSGAVSWLMEMRWSHAFGMLLALIRELWFAGRDTAYLDAQIRRFKPDVIYLGHATNFSKTLLPYLANAPLIYDEGGSGLTDSWTERGIWYKFTDEYVSRHQVLNATKALVVKAVCRLSSFRLKPQFTWPNNMHIFFNGELGLRRAVASGVPVDRAEVIHSGVDTSIFSFRPREHFGSPLRLILPGGIVQRKGQIDGVRLLAKLREQGTDGTMIVVGKTWSDSYFRELTDEIRRLHLKDRVQLMSMIAQDELAGLYQKADICFFPSHQTAGFSRVPLEAMASGSIVISYGNEGSDEIIRDGYNGFLVRPADYESMGAIVREQTSRPDSVREITANARREVESNWSLQRYVDKVEEFIADTVGDRL